MPELKAQVSFGTEANMPEEVRHAADERLAIVRDRTSIDIIFCRVITLPSPTTYYDKPTVKKGKPFYLQMWVRYSELLGDLESNFVAEFYCHNIATCEPVNDYCAAVEGKLKCDTRWIRINIPVTASNEGIFSMSCSFHLPKSELFDYRTTRYYFAVYDDMCDRPGCHIHFPAERIAKIEES